jgi:geranylgeranyl diphosphate synthase type II
MPNKHIAALQASIERSLLDVDLPKTPEKLYQPMRYILSLGGKRVRPTLTLMGAELFGADAKLAIDQALAIEIFHNFTLVHDDIMDRADLRRNTPTVHKKWDDNVAILSGDGMFVLAYQHLAKADAKYLPNLLQVFSKTAMEVCEGQQLDMDLANSEQVSMPEYMEMIRLKTAVLLTAAMQLGAIVAGANDQDLQKIKVFTENIGLAFQIRDDYLDAFGSQDSFGKKIGGDIIEGKRTWLTVNAFEKANADQNISLAQAYSNSNEDERIEQVLTVYSQLEIENEALVEIERYSTTAMLALDSIDGVSDIKAKLIDLVHYLMGRKE